MNSKKLSKPSISFFCPAYNDEKNLPLLIPKVIKLLKVKTSQFEVVIIDDASPDGTGRIADSLAKQFKPFVTVIHHKRNQDYGGAIQSGLKHAQKYDYVFYTDGDNQYDINELTLLLPFIPRFDAVLGFRKNRSLSLARSVQSSIYNFLVHALFPIKQKDVGCAFRLIKTTFIKNKSFNSKSAFIQAEVILTLQKQHAKIKQVAVTHYPRKHGKASGGKPKVILRTIRDIFSTFTQQ